MELVNHFSTKLEHFTMKIVKLCSNRAELDQCS